MKSLKIAGLVIIGLIVVFLIAMAFVPAKYHVERSRVIKAPVDSVFRKVYDLRQWRSWDPWSAMDPEGVQSYSGSVEGIGSVRSWEGKAMGKGSMTLSAVDTNKSIAFDLKFITPFESAAKPSFTFEKVDAQTTKVVWAMEGENAYPVWRAFGLLMLGKIGKDFEQGLAKMDSILTKK